MGVGCVRARVRPRVSGADPAGLVVDPQTKQPVPLCRDGASRRLEATHESLREWVELVVDLWLRNGCV